MNEPSWLNERMVAAFHENQICLHGGLSGIEDENMLAASCARPKHLFAYDNKATIFDLAAAYGYAFAKNHAFVDDNKRVGLVAVLTFLYLNGFLLKVPEMEAVLVISRLAASEETQESVSKWLAENSLKR
ncbi:type II toxin-antitoxin system death-on-curing family toxin [Synechocystis sp. PCC 7509]|uniref:type II toxin-antitoxin system death-on-curing family toxin n=1 Tax=Synechocystis sp. PCC 7509 TaxID=927677 RepID=UPI0002ACA7E2|nr:type II toxin-antitoxin system death-on-curing family toxin [Synechocystis sp. PCC 7509]